MNSKRIQILITVLALLVALAHLFWPTLTIDGVTLVLIAFAIVPWLAPLFKSLELPGGWKIEFRELQEAKDKADKAGLLARSTDEEVVSPEFSFQLVSEEDPNLALAGLRIELEKRLIRLAESRGEPIKKASVGTLLRILTMKRILNTQESSVLADMVGLLNSAVHGAEVDSRAASWAMDVGPRLLKTLDEKIAQSNES